jgi:hypothetical protein
LHFALRHGPAAANGTGWQESVEEAVRGTVRIGARDRVRAGSPAPSRNRPWPGACDVRCAEAACRLPLACRPFAPAGKGPQGKGGGRVRGGGMSGGSVCRPRRRGMGEGARPLRLGTPAGLLYARAAPGSRVLVRLVVGLRV